MKRTRITFSGLLLAALAIMGCAPPSAPPNQPTTQGTEPTARLEIKEHTNNAEDDHGPHGAGPNGGIIFDFGEHHAEFTVDHEKRECAILVLGEDEKTSTAVTARDFSLTIKAFTNKEGTSVPAMNIDLLGDNAVEGKASRFVGTHPDLANVADYEGVAFAEIDGKPSQGEFSEVLSAGTR